MLKEKVIYNYLEPSDIIIFLDDIDQFTFKLSINNFKDKKKFNMKLFQNLFMI